MILQDELKKRKRHCKKAFQKYSKAILTPHKSGRRHLFLSTLWQKSPLSTDTFIHTSTLFRQQKITFRWFCKQNDNHKVHILVLFVAIQAYGPIQANLRIANLAFWQIVYLDNPLLRFSEWTKIRFFHSLRISVCARIRSF